MKFLIGILLLAPQQFLSRRENVLWGGLLPLLLIPFSVWVIMSRSLPVDIKTVGPFAFLFIVLLGMWVEGRADMKKKQKEELEKMKIQDMER